MNIKSIFKSASVLATALLTTIPSFAMKPLEHYTMPDDAKSVLTKSPKETELTILNNYMQSVCAKIFYRHSENPMVGWAIAHTKKTTDINKTIYQIWESGAHSTEAPTDSDLTLGEDFYVLPEYLRKIAKQDSTSAVGEFMDRALLSCLYWQDNCFFERVRTLLRKHNCWYFFEEPGSLFWFKKIIREIRCTTIPFGSLATILSETAERDDFFGNDIIGACIAYKKCQKLGLSCDFVGLVDANDEITCAVIINDGNKRYVVNYLAGVLNIASNGTIHKNIIEEFDDTKYKDILIKHPDTEVRLEKLL